VPKALIEIEAKPIISHVVDMFPGETNFIFVCAQPHLDERRFRMEEILREICPTGRVVGIPSHKLGPSHAVLQVEHLLAPREPVLVNYCDFTCYWDWGRFKHFVWATACDGAIPAYRGFHPHLLGTTNYCYMREAEGWVLDIQEKQHYTNDRMQEFASSGTYYFATAKIMCDAIRASMDQNLHYEGEFYVSLAYKPMLAQSRAVAVYPLQHFMQWGTPHDVAEYSYWSRAFRYLASQAGNAFGEEGAVIVPMAGMGQRFVSEGYALTKPMIPVSGKPMVVQASHDLPPARKHAFVLRDGMPGGQHVSSELSRIYPGAMVRTVDRLTEGQACTAMIGLDALEQELGEVTGPVTIGSCDNGALYDLAKFRNLIGSPDTDVIVWGIRGYANAIRHPGMHSWIRSQGDVVQAISVKSPPEKPETDAVVMGTFTFRRAEDFRRAVRRMIARNGRTNGEFYIDACINSAIEMGLRCRLFEVDSYLCWGTPDDLRTFEYWQSCLHKWPSHPYRLERDARVAQDQIADLASRYQAMVPELPGRRP
jgi:NDP-sugar pyrophosphorylase family protein